MGASQGPVRSEIAVFLPRFLLFSRRIQRRPMGWQEGKRKFLGDLRVGP